MARLGAQLQAVKETEAARASRAGVPLRHIGKDVPQMNLDALSQKLEGLARNDELADLEESLSELTREAHPRRRCRPRQGARA